MWIFILILAYTVKDTKDAFFLKLTSCCWFYFWTFFKASVSGQARETILRTYEAYEMEIRLKHGKLEARPVDLRDPDFLRHAQN